MDKHSTLIMIGIIIAIILPFLVYNLIQKIRKSSFRKKFHDLINKEGLNITAQDIWNKFYAIGYDGNSGKLVYIRKHGGDFVSYAVDMNQVELCRVLRATTDDPDESARRHRSHRLDLYIGFRERNRPELKLEFYNNHAFYPNADDFALIEKWLGILSDKA
jgi:hypothetical protein